MLRNAFFFVAACVAACGHASPPGAAAPGPDELGPPPAGLSMPCRIVEVYDGDTMVVELRVRARVRLVDCWCDEVRTRDPEEKRRGLAARDHLARLCGMKWNEEAKRWRPEPGRPGPLGWLHAPFPGTGDVGSIFSMSRLVGSVWLYDADASLAAEQVAAGHAFRTKAELKGSQRRVATPRAAPGSAASR